MSKPIKARISILTSTLIKRLENIFAATLQTGPDQSNGTNTINGPSPPTLVETAAEQFSLDHETTALISATEQIMVLTRTMKDLWLFGALDTIHDGEDGVDEKVKEDQEYVQGIVRRYLAGGTDGSMIKIANGDGKNGDKEDGEDTGKLQDMEGVESTAAT